MVSLLKAWKVTVLGIECNRAAFERHFIDGPHQKLFFSRILFQNSVSKMAHCICASEASPTGVFNRNFA